LQTLKAGLLYFVVVFGAGFVLGPIRVMWLVPRFGTRAAELMEMPIMLAVTILAARWIVCLRGLLPTPSKRLGVGIVALALLLMAELTLVLWLRGLAIHKYIASRDPLAGTVYIVMLGAFAIMPLLFTRR
jgi:type IV secretory pathway TrbD component